MSTANALIGAVLFYGFLVLLGRATIVLCHHQLSSLETKAISSVVGLAVLTLLTTYLVVLGVPLASVSRNITFGIAFLATTYLALRPVNSYSFGVDSARFGYLIPLVATTFLVSLPFAIGGYEFAVLRGNGTDSFNYVTMADALSRYNLDWISAQTKETLASLSPNLPLAQDLLNTRWSTSALLAFVSRSLGLSSIEFEYAFTLTLIIILFDALVAAMCATRSLTKLTVWVAVVFVVGFWGQFTLDIRAFSQIASLPMLVTLAGWLLSFKNLKEPVFSYGVPVTAILTAALSFQYPEIVMAFLPGCGLIFVFRLWERYGKGEFSTKDMSALLAALFLTLLLCSPIIRFLTSFALEQGRFAVNKSIGWESAYFSWMTNPVRGLWGVGVNTGLGIGFDRVFAGFSFLVAWGLTFGVGVRTVMIVSSREQRRENISEIFLLVLCFSGLIGSVILLLRGNIWASGKVVSYFSALIPAWMAIFIAKIKIVELKSGSLVFKVMSYVLIISIVGWGVINVALAGIRIFYAKNEGDFPGYISQHGEYRRVKADAVADIDYFNCPIGFPVAVFEPTTWGRELLTHLVEGKGFSAFTPGFSLSRSAQLSEPTGSGGMKCVLANRKYYDSTSLPKKTNSQFSFFAASPGEQFATLLDLEGGYGPELDRATATQYVLTGKEDITLFVLARASAYSIGLKLCSGVVRNLTDALTVSVEIDGKLVSQNAVSGCVDLNIQLTGSELVKMHEIRVSNVARGADSTRLGLDPRDLRLRVEVTRISLEVSGI